MTPLLTSWLADQNNPTRGAHSRLQAADVTADKRSRWARTCLPYPRCPLFAFTSHVREIASNDVQHSHDAPGKSRGNRCCPASHPPEYAPMFTDVRTLDGTPSTTTSGSSTRHTRLCSCSSTSFTEILYPCRRPRSCRLVEMCSRVAVDSQGHHVPPAEVDAQLLVRLNHSISEERAGPDQSDGMKAQTTTHTGQDTTIFTPSGGDDTSSCKGELRHLQHHLQLTGEVLGGRRHPRDPQRRACGGSNRRGTHRHRENQNKKKGDWVKKKLENPKSVKKIFRRIGGLDLLHRLSSAPAFSGLWFVLFLLGLFFSMTTRSPIVTRSGSRTTTATTPTVDDNTYKDKGF
ncbi:hypothetical protein Esi_0044_0006 [Ectocarpus siliculosus]|uniref:Uncharacterized protein n=1 Tax=Ectocarpus siliculosus TaxID=2880 RepID=D8LN99_ECTSI|nr:hypothetical protein Esi_0044_0006 [Ectocarpus siliculosus]|eukprot:CBN77256.1 hypothetical protein Esi_0044_0006 [Ectocarpus siliculosus]